MILLKYLDESIFFLFFRESATKLLNSLETFTREAEDQYPDNWNGKNMMKYGFQLCQGLKAFAESDYEEAFKLLKPIRQSIYIRVVSSLILFSFGIHLIPSWLVLVVNSVSK